MTTERGKAMKTTITCLVLMPLLVACASGVDQGRIDALYNKYDSHCKEHAREMAGEATEEIRYQECMTYFTETDIHCPNCAVDAHLTHKQSYRIYHCLSSIHLNQPN